MAENANNNAMQASRLTFESIHADYLFIPSLKHSAHLFSLNVSEQCSTAEWKDVLLIEVRLHNSGVHCYAKPNSLEQALIRSYFGLLETDF